jgi:hypothetical protein
MKFISWWCNLLGINDPAAIQVASGVFAAGSALLIA